VKETERYDDNDDDNEDEEEEEELKIRIQDSRLLQANTIDCRSLYSYLNRNLIHSVARCVQLDHATYQRSAFRRLVTGASSRSYRTCEHMNITTEFLLKQYEAEFILQP
jgi:hypothetical protein